MANPEIDNYVHPADPMTERLEKVLAEGHCNDTCSAQLIEDGSVPCDCWKAAVREAICEPSKPTLDPERRLGCRLHVRDPLDDCENCKAYAKARAEKEPAE